MENDMRELIEYLDQKFQGTASKKDLEVFATKKDLEEMASNFVTFEEFDQFRAEVKEEFAAIRASLNSLTNSVDQLVKVVSDLRIEYAAVSHQLTRHEQWIQQIADKVGVKLNY